MQILRGVIFVQFCLAIIAIIAGRYFDGAMFIIISLVGVCVAQNSRRSSMLMACFFIFQLIQAVWGTLYMILYLADVSVYPIPRQTWKKALLDTSIYGLVAAFYIGAIVCYLIFNEVRNIIYAPQIAQQAAGGAPGTSIDDIESGHRQQASPKEKEKEKKAAFSGKGQALGGGGPRENPWRSGGPPRSNQSRPA